MLLLLNCDTMLIKLKVLATRQYNGEENRNIIEVRDLQALFVSVYSKWSNSDNRNHLVTKGSLTRFVLRCLQ